MKKTTTVITLLAGALLITTAVSAQLGVWFKEYNQRSSKD